MNEHKPDIQLYNESGRDVPVDEELLHKCVAEISHEEGCSYSLLEIVYVDESAIIDINKEYLNRDYVTDIITFRYDEDASYNNIEGTLYCCAQRIYEQSSEYDVSPENEFKRILVHGLLHLCGYDDRTSEDKERMTQRENFYLQIV